MRFVVITIYIVRHGETKLNNDTDTSQDRIRGWLDVPLTDQGRKEAKIAAEKLKKYKIEVIYCSDLSRAEETASIIGKILGIKHTPSKKLRPWNLGKLAGTSTKEALPQIAKYVREKPQQKVPEGESFEDFSDRAFEGIAEAINKAKGENLCIVTHHRDERLLSAWNKAGQPANHKIDLDVFLQKGDKPGGLIIMEIDEKKLNSHPKMEAGSVLFSPKDNAKVLEALKHKSA
jgi:broad specificity phosphatase PhoE